MLVNFLGKHAPDGMAGKLEARLTWLELQALPACDDLSSLRRTTKS